MKRITITLTDEEYADLERRAAADRRSARDMAAYLVTKPQGGTITPDWTWRPQPYIPPYLVTSICYACRNPGVTGVHTCGLGGVTTTTNTTRINAARID